MHRRAKLTVFGRRLLVERIEQEGWPIAHAAAMTGVSRQTATKWVRRYRAEGLVGLEDRSSRPNRSPRALTREQVAAILAARHELGLGPHRLAPVVGSPRSTISDVLRRHGLSRLRDRDRPSGVPIRYVRERPGELLHIDVKKLGRIPDGGGHRFRGRGNGTPKSRAGYDYVHQAIDDMSRVAYVDVLSDERGPTCARFLREAAAWFARQGTSGPGTSGPDRAVRRPTARASASTGPCSTSGPTSGPTGRTTSGCSLFGTSSTITTTIDPTPR